MGHIRLGRLPKTKPWTDIFDALADDSLSPERLAGVVADSARIQIEGLKQDRGINYCLWVLVRIITASRSNDFQSELNRLNINVPATLTGPNFIQQVSRSLEKEIKTRTSQATFSQIAQTALREILSAGITEQSRTLFGTQLKDIQSAFRSLSTQNRFGDLVKEFFGKFLGKTIRFISDKEISNYVGSNHALKSPEEVIKFHRNLDRYCMESAKIVEEFASGWFSKTNWETNNNISEEDTAGFTSFALEKIRMELREASQ